MCCDAMCISTQKNRKADKEYITKIIENLTRLAGLRQLSDPQSSIFS